MKKTKVLYLLGVALVCAGIYLAAPDSVDQKRFGTLDESLLVQIPMEELPEDTLYITYDRRLYQRGAMSLIIPAIGVYTPVGESTEPEQLKEMPGLYEFAAMPNEAGGNTSIAGHRDIYDMVFYSLDKVKEGDYLYLLHAGMVYRYEYKKLVVVRPDDWSVIMRQEFDSLTLTTCDPIGTTLNRLVVQGELKDFQEFDEAYRFIPNNRTIP